MLYIIELGYIFINFLFNFFKRLNNFFKTMFNFIARVIVCLVPQLRGYKYAGGYCHYLAIGVVVVLAWLLISYELYCNKGIVIQTEIGDYFVINWVLLLGCLGLILFVLFLSAILWSIEFLVVTKVFVVAASIVMLYFGYELFLANSSQLNPNLIYRSGGCFNTRIYAGIFVHMYHTVSAGEAEMLFASVLSDNSLSFCRIAEYLQIWPVSRQDFHVELIRLLLDDKISEAEKYIQNVDLAIQRNGDVFFIGCILFSGVMIFKRVLLLLGL